jgi:hypothetical protein
MMTWFEKKQLVGLVLAAALLAPAASAKTSSSVTIPSELAHIQQPGGISDLAWLDSFQGGPGSVYGIESRGVQVPAELSYIRAPGSVSYLAQFEGFRGGPGSVTDAVRYPASAPAPNARGFDWAAAAVGAGFAAGIALLAAAGLGVHRRRRLLAQA